MSVARVVILGGGTAGWMTAAALSKALERTGTAVTLVESEEIGTIGVGEATIPTIHWFNALVGLDEARFMAETKATYKLGIEFRGWRGDGHRYLHPFGTFGGPGDATMFPHRLIRAWLAGADLAADDFCLTAQAAAARRFAKPANDPRSLLSTLGYAFHFDAALYARHLRGLAEARGVVRVEGRVAEVARADDGRVAALCLADGRAVAGDLFVDCSGLKGLLIEGAMGEPYEDWGDRLPCDAAWAVPSPREDGPPTPWTMAVAMGAGWRWRIPLQHRVGNGYVFSTRFTTPEAARAALLAAVPDATAEPRLIRFRPGRRRRAWVGNVVAVGLSSGFLEPLESTSIHLIQANIGKLLSLFPRDAADPLLAEQYNRLFVREVDEVRDFLLLHYAMTEGRTEPFWRHVQAAEPPASLGYKLDQYRRTGRIVLGLEELFRDASWFAVLTGQGVRAADYNPLLDVASDAENLRQLGQLKAAIHAAAQRLPPFPRALG